jgi:hypothetical protein
MTPTNTLVPREYSYDPRWQIIALNFGAGLGWLCLVRISNGRLNLFSVILGLIPITMAILLAIRRLVFKRHLVLDIDAILLPTGFLRVRAVRIPYNDIKRVWWTRLIWINVICFGTNAREIRDNPYIASRILQSHGHRAILELSGSTESKRNSNPRLTAYL